MEPYKVEPNKFNFDLAKDHQLRHTHMQWILAVIVVCIMAAAVMLGAVFTLWPNAQLAAFTSAEFGVLIFAGLLGGLIPKADYPIHVLGEEMLQLGDYHEHLRSLHRKQWLNFLPDVVGLLPAGLFLAIIANVIISRVWMFSFSVDWIFLVNGILLVASAVMIPLVCAKGHEEVKEQVRKNNTLPKKETRMMHSRSEF